jgi:hypothetical protein
MGYKLFHGRDGCECPSGPAIHSGSARRRYCQPNLQKSRRGVLSDADRAAAVAATDTRCASARNWRNTEGGSDCPSSNILEQEQLGLTHSFLHDRHVQRTDRFHRDQANCQRLPDRPQESLDGRMLFAAERHVVELSKAAYDCERSQLRLGRQPGVDRRDADRAWKTDARGPCRVDAACDASHRFRR